MKNLNKLPYIFASLTLFLSQSQASYDKIEENLNEVTKTFNSINVNPVEINVSYGDLEYLTKYILADHILPYCNDKIISLNRSFFSLVTGYTAEHIKDLGFGSHPGSLVANISRTKKLKFNKLENIEQIPSFIWYSLLEEVKRLPSKYWIYLKRTQIKTLDLSSCGIGNEEIKKFPYDFLFENLDLSENEIEDEGAQTLANMMITNLNLAYNEVSDKGAKYLSQNKTLRNLNLQSNEVGVEGAKSLTQENSNLMTLNLAYNFDISDEIVQDLRHNTPHINLTLSVSVALSHV